MVSLTHQWLLLWVARKMALDGFLLAGFEGPAPQGGLWNRLPPSFEIAGARPDAWGFSPDTGEVAIGEAKTADDLLTTHSLDQIRIFGSLLRKRTNKICHLYLAVPRSAAPALDLLLVRAGLIGRPHLIRLHIPDTLITADSRYDHVQVESRRTTPSAARNQLLTRSVSRGLI